MNNKDLEKAAKEYARNYTVNDNGNGGDDWEDDIAIAYRAGAQWMELQFENNRLSACESMTEEEAEREQEFVVKFTQENHRQPTYSDCIEMTRQQVISKACKWLENNLDCMASMTPEGELYWLPNCIESFRKAMEE